MKKLFGIVICLLLLVCAVAPTLAFAAAGNASNIIYFLNPTAIAALDGKLYVADNIEAGNSVLLCFDVKGSNPAYEYTTEVNGDVTNLSVKEGGLYAVLKDKVIEYAIGDKSLTLKQSFDVKDAVNFVWGVYRDRNVEYYASEEQLYRNNNGEFWGAGVGTLSNVKDIDFIGDNVYYLHGDNAAKLQRWNGKEGGVSPNDIINTKLDISDSGAKGLFTRKIGENSFPGFFSDSSIAYVEIANESCNVVTMLNYDTDQKGKIADVVEDGGTLYVLNDKNSVEIYKGNTENYTLSSVIGTDTLPGEVPTAFTSFTLVQRVGYPANIVFKTSGERSVETLVDNAAEYIVLGYDGDERSDFYYVLYGDSFGWVKKSDGATAPADDGKLRVVDTSVSQGVVEYKTKFVSLGAVWVYPLPREAFKPNEAYEQSASTRKEVTVLQRFTEGNTVWYYVRYDGDKLGFVTEENVGKFYLSANIDDAPVVGERKANGKLFGFVQLYDNNLPETMDDDHCAYNEKGDIIHLGSGTRVTLIEEYSNGTALVQVAYGDGSTATGYCLADRLIAVTALTTNAVFGLIATGIAVVLIAVLTAVFVKRSKNKKATDEPEAKENEN